MIANSHILSLDTYVDIWPVEERPATYCNVFREWRPESMLPLHSSSDDESLEEVLENSLTECTRGERKHLAYKCTNRYRVSKYF